MKIRRLLRILHRDLGYFVTGMLLIYAISGIALNHRKDWNPDYRVISKVIQVERSEKHHFSEEEIKLILNQFDEPPIYKKHFTSKQDVVKVFVEGGMVIYEPESGVAELELLLKRPIFYHINKLHMAATSKAWIWVSDFLSILLIFVGISGLFLLKGKKGLWGRGLWLMALGFAVPLYFLIFYIS